MMVNKKIVFCLLILLFYGCKDKKNIVNSVTPVTHKTVTEHREESPRRPDVEIYMDLTKPHTGKAFILMIYQVSEKNRPSSFIEMGREEEFHFYDVKFYGDGGRILNYSKDSQKYIIETEYNREIFIEYSVKPGGKGRHGRQGNISEDFASFNGRIFILPDETYKINSGRIKYEVPDRWKIINPHRKQGSWYYPDNSGKDLIYESILKSPVACGPFEQVKKKVGHTDVYVSTYSPWKREYKEKITEKSFILYNYFYEHTGFDPGFPYIICWTPSYDGDKVFGGIWSNGMCYEMETDNLRNWELFAHRTGHAINQYDPTGMTMRDSEDMWFIEAWPSYIEIESTSFLKFADNIKSWEKLYDHYIKTIEKYPQYDYPLVRDYEVRNSDSIEFLHYTKGPLVMKMLSVEMNRSSGKTMEQFMKYAYKKYGNFKKAFPFKEELERWSGTSFEYFYENMIRKKGTVRPLWRH